MNSGWVQRTETVVRTASVVTFVMALALSARADESYRVRLELRAAISQMEGTTSRLRALLMYTRQGRDPSKIACVDEALSRADVALRHAKEAMRAALDAYARDDEEGAQNFVRQVAVHKSAVKTASAHADECAAGFGQLEPDTTVVVVHRSK